MSSIYLGFYQALSEISFIKRLPEIDIGFSESKKHVCYQAKTLSRALSVSKHPKAKLR